MMARRLPLLLLLLFCCVGGIAVLVAAQATAGGGVSSSDLDSKIVAAVTSTPSTTRVYRATGATIQSALSATHPGDALYNEGFDEMMHGNATAGAEMVTQAAALGNPAALSMLATMHGHGILVPRNDALSLLHHTFAALAGSVSSHLALAHRYEHGIGVEVNIVRAAEHAQFAAGAAIQTFRTSTPSSTQVNRFDDHHASEVASMSHEVLQLHLLQAEKGVAKSAMFVGYAFLHGLYGAEQNGALAVDYFKLAIAKGEEAGHGALGQVYAQGVMTSNSKQQRTSSSASSAAASSPSSASLLKAQPNDKALEDASTGKEVTEIVTEEDGDKDAAAVQSQEDDEDSSASGATTKQHSGDIPRDLIKAKYHFLLGAKAKSPPAYNGVGYLYGIGALSPDGKPDFKTAADYFRMSAEANNGEGLYNYGLLHLTGRGVPKDLSAAVGLLTRAAASGSYHAKWQLANLHLAGLGHHLGKSPGMAIRYYKDVYSRGPWMFGGTAAKEAYRKGLYGEAFLRSLMMAEMGVANSRHNAALLLSQHGSALEHLAFQQTSSAQPNLLASSSSSSSSATGAPLDGEGTSSSSAVASTNPVARLIHSLVLRSALEGSLVSHVQLADQYRLGEGTSVNLPKAFAHYMIASNGHNGRASYNLGWMYETGTAAQKDYHLAKRFYDKALQEEPEASFAVSFALVKLNFIWWWEHFVAAPASSSAPAPAAAGTRTTGPSSETDKSTNAGGGTPSSGSVDEEEVKRTLLSQAGLLSPDETAALEGSTGVSSSDSNTNPLRADATEEMNSSLSWFLNFDFWNPVVSTEWNLRLDDACLILIVAALFGLLLMRHHGA